MIRVFGWETTLAAEHWFRIGMPFPLLDRARFEVTCGEPGPDIHDYDVVFTHRLAGPAPVWHELCTDPNVLTVYDMDDDLLCVDPQNVGPYRLFHPLETETRRNVLAADVVTVSSPGLLERYSEIHPRVVLLPICIPDDMPDWPIPARSGPPVIGWAGSMHKRQDWPGVAEALAEVARIRPDARFVTYGGNYTKGLLGGQLKHIPFTMDVMEYYRSIEFDVGVAPLVDTRFNRGKCHTKLIEYGARGIPTVASAIGQYAQWTQHGVNGYLVHDRAEWVPYLLALLDDGTRMALAKAAHDSSREWVISKHIHCWEEVFAGQVAG